MLKAYGIIKKITKKLVREYHPEKIILFGSYAYGKPDRDSDIDLLVISRTDLPFYKRLVKIRGLISDLRRGYPFEPIVLTPAEIKERISKNDKFIEEIMRRGKVLYAG